MNKRIRRIIVSLAVVIASLVSVMPVYASHDSDLNDKTPRMSMHVKELTIYCDYGEPVMLYAPSRYLKGEYKWTSSKPKVASVEWLGNTCYVTGLKPGKSTITVTKGNKKLTCKVTVKKDKKMTANIKSMMSTFEKNLRKSGLVSYIEYGEMMWEQGEITEGETINGVVMTHDTWMDEVRDKFGYGSWYEFCVLNGTSYKNYFKNFNETNNDEAFFIEFERYENGYYYFIFHRV